MEGNSVQLLQGVIFRPQRSRGEELGYKAQVSDLWFRRFCCCWVITNPFVFILALIYCCCPAVDPSSPAVPILMLFEHHGISGVGISHEQENGAEVCTWTRAKQSSSEMSRKCGSLPSVYRGTIRELDRFMFHFAFRTSCKNIEECFCQQWWHTSAL